MSGSKQRSSYRTKRARVFSGKRKQEVTSAERDANYAALGPVSMPPSCVAHSPPNGNGLEEINENCPLIIKQNEAVVTRRRAIELRRFTKQKEL